MAALANKIGDDPVLFSLLDIFNSQRRQFGAPQTASQEIEFCAFVGGAKAALQRSRFGSHSSPHELEDQPTPG